MGGAPRIGPASEGRHGVSLVPSEGPFREGMPHQHGRTLGKRTVAAVAIDTGPQEGAATEESVTIGNGLYLLGRIGGNGVSFLVDTGSGVSILVARTWKEWGRTEDELTRYWGRLCSVEGRALESLGKARLTVTLGTRVVEWGFIVAEIGDDEGILGNDFAKAHELTVRPCEGAVYLPDHTGTGRGHLGEPGRHRPAPDPHGRPARHPAMSQALPRRAPRGETAIGRGHVGHRHHPGKQQRVE